MVDEDRLYDVVPDLDDDAAKAWIVEVEKERALEELEKANGRIEGIEYVIKESNGEREMTSWRREQAFGEA